MTLRKHAPPNQSLAFDFSVVQNTAEGAFRTAGCICYAGRMPCNSSALVTRLLDANGIVLGKTRMHELAMGATTINPNGGPVLNPHNNIMHVGGEGLTGYSANLALVQTEILLG